VCEHGCHTQLHTKQTNAWNTLVSFVVHNIY